MSDTIDYDPFGPETMADPAAAHAELRARCPVHRHDGAGHPMYSVALRADVHEILTRPDLWSNERGPGVGYASGRIGDVQHFDPPEHTARRTFLRDAFLPGSVNAMEPRLRELATELLDQLPSHGSADLVEAFAHPLPVLSFCELMGVPTEDSPRFREWSDALVLSMARPEHGVDARRAFDAYLHAAVAERRADPDAAPQGLLTTLSLRPFRGEPMPVDELVVMASQLLTAGHETTTSLVSNLVFRLLERPELWAAVRADRALVPAAVEESLRFDPPVLGLCRTNNDPVNLGDEELAPDTKVMALFASANRDPELFEDPDSFRLDRDPLAARRHYAFGWGIHFCLGTHLARLTGRVAISALLDRFDVLHLDGTPTRIASPFLWGRRTLPVRW